MKRFWNWKTALVGILTALLLTGVSVGAYVLYCQYLHQRYGFVSYFVQTQIEASDVEQTNATVLVQSDGVTTEYDVEATPSLEMVRTLCGYHFVFYKELQDRKRARSGKDPYLRYQDLLFGDKPVLELPSNVSDSERKSLQESYDSLTMAVKEAVEGYLMMLENQFGSLNRDYDYWVLDHEAARAPLTNTDVQDVTKIDLSQYAFLFQVDYDDHGVPTISDANCHASSDEELRKNLNSVLHEKNWQLLGGNLDLQEITNPYLRAALEKACMIKNPAGCSVIIGITKLKYQMINGMTPENGEWDMFFELFACLSVKVVCFAILGLAMFSGLFYLNSRSEEKRANRILARAPIELVAALVMLLYSAEYPLHRWMTALYLEYETDYVSATLFVFFLCIVAWYVGGCIGEMRIIGIKEYVKKRFLILIVLSALIRHVKKIYGDYRSLNLDMDLRRKILRLVIINAIVVSGFCVGWVFGIIGVVIYSVCLYFIVLKYAIHVQKDYQELRRMTREMAEGNLKYEPEGSLGLFEPAKEDLVQIRNGFDKAVQEEVKSHKLKTELITNVSHDLKTPLTAIITYVNLLKEKNLTQEQIASYVDTLDKKSLRLKRLIEDLFEVSKANSGNIQLNLQNCDLANLVKQCFYEVQDKLEERNLITRLSLPTEKVILKLDGEKTYRIYENLFNNIVKYAMAGTRVYVIMTEEPDRVLVTVKNITEAELYVPAQELTERFVRGDASRGRVEGSGLGLAIVRSFTELQGGKLELEIDGDLFKVTTVWMKPQ